MRPRRLSTLAELPSAPPADRMLDAALYQTSRLALRPPRHDDAAAMFRRIASDPRVTRFVAWPMHTSLRDTESFLAFSQAEWTKWPVGPLLITSRTDGAVLGSTELAFETSYRASTGFVLARDAWGACFACEALAAVVEIATALRVRRSTRCATCNTRNPREFSSVAASFAKVFCASTPCSRI